MKKTILIALSMIFAVGGLAACGEHKHKFGEWEIVEEATCLKDGLRKRTCAEDGFTQEEVIHAVGYHTFGSDNKCVRGDFEIKYTANLAYIENADKTGYLVGRGNADATQIVLPAYCDGKPVVGVMQEGFSSPNGTNTPAAKIESVWIPDGVTEIGERAFYGAVSLKTVTLPNGLKTIARSAFNGCRALTEINAPEELDSIGASAFSGCSSLLSAPLGKALKTVGNYAFRGCVALKNVSFGALTEIGEGAFSDCSLLETVTFGGPLKEIPKIVFSHCGKLREITLPAGLESIGAAAFEYCGSVEIFRFGGTVAEWKAIDKAGDWFAGDFDPTDLPTFYVICSDGTVNQNNTPAMPPQDA